MINGQDVLLHVADIIIKEGREYYTSGVATRLSQRLNLHRNKSHYIIQLMINEGYLDARLKQNNKLPQLTQHVSLTPKACARIREINAQRRIQQRAFEHEDAIARAETMGDYERASRMTRELLEA